MELVKVFPSIDIRGLFQIRETPGTDKKRQKQFLDLYRKNIIEPRLENLKNIKLELEKKRIISSQLTDYMQTSIDSLKWDYEKHLDEIKEINSNMFSQINDLLKYMKR